MTELDARSVRELLEELGRRLAARGSHATLYVVGGAAMALELDQRRITADVDAIFEPDPVVRSIAADIAEERGLPPHWLNSSARPWVPGGDSGTVLFESDGLAVTVASPQHLLAMKMAASRPQDLADLQVLFAALDITRPEQAADLALQIYGEHSVALTPRDDLILIATEVLNRPADPPAPGIDCS